MKHGERCRRRKQNPLKPYVGNHTDHGTDGRMETKGRDMRKREKRHVKVHDSKLCTVSERNGTVGVHEQL